MNKITKKNNITCKIKNEALLFWSKTEEVLKKAVPAHIKNIF